MKAFLVSSLLLVSSAHMNAQTFDEADALFDQREGNEAVTIEAREAYLAIANSGVTGSDLIRAVVGASRTYVYQGEALVETKEGADYYKRRDIFGECRETIEMISPEAIGSGVRQYYYFKAACMAYYAQVSGTLENLGLVGPLQETLDVGLTVPGGDTYEGGGLKRVKAAVQSNPKTKPIPGGYYNPELALELINEAIDSFADGDSYDGWISCENQRRKVNVLIELERQDEAVAVGEAAVADFNLYLEFDFVPSEITAETVHCIEEIETILATLG